MPASAAETQTPPPSIANSALQRFQAAEASTADGREPARGRVHLSRRRLIGLGAAGALLAAAQPLSRARGSEAPGNPPAAEAPAAPAARKTPPPMPQYERWLNRFPQPVLVSDLIGRQMLNRGQGIFGFIKSVVRNDRGDILIAFARRRLFFFEGEVVAVPADVTALLGQFVVILDMTDDQVAALAPFSPAGTTPVDGSVRILMALTRN